MRLAHVFLGFSCTVFCSAIAVTARQDQPLAEQQFKNIKTLKGEKASEVIPAMEFMSASLKVGCDFCHTADRASDEKRAKNTARAMIEMQRDINERHFEGRSIVSCATCHAGHPHPLAVPPIEGLDVRPRRSADVNVDQVLAAFAKASGEDATHQVPGFILRGTIDQQGHKSGFDAYYSNRRYVLVTHGDKGEQKQGFDGSTLWFTMPNGVQRVPLQYGERFMNESELTLGPTSLPKLDNPAGETAQVVGKDMSVVSGMIDGEQTRLSLYFDKQTGLLARTSYGYPTILGMIVQINDYSDYKRIGGVEVPMTIAIHSSEGESVEHFSSARIAQKVDPASFAPPTS